VRTAHCLALLLLGCSREPHPPVAVSPPPAPLPVADLARTDAGSPPAVSPRAAAREVLADAGSEAWTTAPGAPVGGSSGFRAPPTDDGDAALPVGPRRPPGPVPTMDSKHQVKPPPFNKHTAPPPGPLFPRGPANAVDAGPTGPLSQ
jgi:hypothetical protein